MNLIDQGIFVREINLPMHIKGITVPNSDGTFDIYINTNLRDGLKQATLEHELRHIKLDHFYITTECIAIEEIAADCRIRTQ